jgi:hypothetical protein
MTNSILQTIGAAEAARLLDQYCDPTSKNAWPLYDDDPSPDTLCGADLTAPALLSYPITRKYLDGFGRHAPNPDKGDETNPYRRLFTAMATFVGEQSGLTFADLPDNVVKGTDKSPPVEWSLFVACLDEVQHCGGLWSTAVTKILHRKRPHLVPVNDSLVREFYGARNSYRALFESIHQELNDKDTVALLEDLAGRYKTPRGRTMTTLRALDIIVWMHMKSSRK